MKHGIVVALAGASPTGAENLGLAYIAEALDARGHHATILPYRGVMDLDRAAHGALRIAPRLLGVAMPSGDAAIEALAFVYRIRQLGYRGHVTCGGTFATLARGLLLERHRVLDSVIRHDGEIPMVALADAIANGSGWTRLPGISTREGDGLASPVGDSEHLNIMPRRPVLKRYAGVPAAKISAVRGCFGRCRYCGLKALRQDAVKEGLRCGLDTDQMLRLGVGDIRRRPVDSVAEEMASLYREGVRFFHFVDENHLPRNSEEAEQAILNLNEALRKRSVGNRAISLMLRSDSVTPKVADALHRLGLTRCLLGVESMSRAGLKALGRGHAPDPNLRAMEILRRHRVMFHFNLLLVHPDSTLDSIADEIDMLHRVRGGLIDPFQVEVYYGTDLYRRLEREGRLVGGPLLFHYWPEEKGARRFAEIFYQLKRRVLGVVHLTGYAYEVLGTYGVARRLGMLKMDARPIEQEVEHLIDAHNALWLDLLSESRRLAERDASRREVDAFLKESKVRAAHLVLAFRDLRNRIERSASDPLVSEIYYPRTAAAVALALSILASPGCQKTAGDVQDNGGDTASETAEASPSDTDIPSETDSGASSEVDTGSGIPERTDGETQTNTETETATVSGTRTEMTAETGFVTEPDGGTDGVPTAGSPTDTGTETQPISTDPACDSERASRERGYISEQAGDRGCENPYNYARCFGFELDQEGHVIDMVLDNNGWSEEAPDAGEITESLKACYLAAVEGQTFPCLHDYKEAWYQCLVILA